MFMQLTPEPTTLVLGFNCPPKSGKDTIAVEIAKLLEGQIPCSIQSLAAPMREIAMEFTGLQTFKDYNEYKDIPNPLFSLDGSEGHVQHSIRQFMIALSESFIKPVYGREFWARHLINRLKWWGKERMLCIIPDFGFKEETDLIADSVGHSNFCMVRLYRDGTDFSIDSRNFVDCPNVIHIDNNRTPKEAADDILIHLVDVMKWNLLATSV
jgi:hypothetical protein